MSKRFLITLLTLFLFSILYGMLGIINEYIGKSLILVYILLPSLALTSGYFFSIESKHYKRIYLFVFSIMVSTTLFIIISYFKTVGYFGTLDNAADYYGNRAIGSMWSIQDKIPATNLTLRLLIPLSIIPIIFLFNKDLSRKSMITSKALVLISFISTFPLTIQLGSRTSIVLLITISLFSYLFMGSFNFKKFLNLAMSFVSILLAYFLYYTDFLNIKTWWYTTTAYKRFSNQGLESSRTDAWFEVLEHFFQNPFGGREISININYVHNLWLDVVYDVGWITGLILIIFTLMSISAIMRFYYSNYPIYLKLILLLIFIGFLVFFMTEPIMATNERDYFVLFCFFVGIVLGLNKRNVE